MSTSQPPRLASWLVRRFAGGPQRESLVGDLDEQFARGRSSRWYWRQVVTTLLVCVARDLREHRLLAVRSVILTWALVIAWVEITLALYLWVSETWVYAWVADSVIFYFWHPCGGGLCLIWCAGSGVAGWVSAQRSATHRLAMVVASALAQLPLALWWSSSVWLHLERWAGAPARLWVPSYVSAVIIIVGMPAAAVFGGLWRADDVPVQLPVR